MLTLSKQGMFIAVGGSVRGASHRANGKPNQDSVSFPRARVGDVVAAAISDGHGSQQYFRSDFGSHAAAISGRSVLNAAVTSDKKNEQVSAAAVRELIETRVPRSIYSDWRRRVTGHLDEVPLSEFELSRVTPAQEAELRANPLEAYGCTLLSAALGESYGALARIGDGTVVVIDAAGIPYRPFQEDDSGGDESTESLCCANAAHLIQSVHLDYANGPPQGVILATDGYTKSFSGPEDFLSGLESLFRHAIEHGVDDLERQLKGVLDNTTHSGTGDDTTVAMIINQNALVEEEDVSC